MKTLIATLFLFVALITTGVVSVGMLSSASVSSLLASVFFVESISGDGLKKKYDASQTTSTKIRIVLVPGHEPDFGGAEYRNVKERDMAVDLARELAEYLKNDSHYEVIITRDKTMWNTELENYFGYRWSEIREFVSTQKLEMARLVGEGRIARVGDQVPHNDAPDDVAMRLYGINKWANEKNADIVIHIHFNDSAPRNMHTPGDYSGFAIYVPERQYSNAGASKEVAKKVFHRLERFMPVSDLPVEDAGIVEEQELIAIGSANTVDGASMLVEYGYVYEPQFSNSATRRMAIRELALQTYLGLADYFGDTTVEKHVRDTTILPYEWTNTLTKNTKANPDVLAAQVAFMREGLYPPNGTTKNDCPPSGVYGVCTTTAAALFQDRFDVSGDGTAMGPQTRAKLNELYGAPFGGK